jgi:hypothetical protein
MSSVAYAFVVCLALSLSSPPLSTAKTKPPSSSTALSLLEEAEHISRSFVPDDHAELLLEAAQSAVPISAPKAETWALQLFTFSKSSLEPGGHYRVAMEKNALTVLARIDPVRSAKMFRRQDIPTVKESPGEDPRSTSVVDVLFPALYKKKGRAALPKIKELANWLGSTGEYPYPAIASLIIELDKSDKQEVAPLFSGAISYLPRDPGFLNTNRNFTNMVLKVRKAVPQPLLRQAITEDVAAITRTENSKKDSARYVVTSVAGTQTFDSEGPVLIYRLLPVVEQMDPDWAARLKTDFGLAGIATPALDQPLTVSGAITPPGQEQSASNAELQAALNQSRLMRAQQLSANDPKAAVQLAQQITDPELRSVALVSAAPAYEKLDAGQADAWVSGAKEQLNSMPAGVNKLRLMIALIKVNIANDDEENAKQQTGRAYDLGEEIFEEDLRANPGKFSGMAEGFDELVDLTSVGARQPWLSGNTLDHVRQVRNDVLRARLLVEQAKGMTDERHAAG